MNNLLAYYEIAGHPMELLLPNGVDADLLLPTFCSFRIAAPKIGTKKICRVEIIDGVYKDKALGARLLSNNSVSWGDRFRFYETDDGYLAEITPETSHIRYCMWSTKDFSTSQIYIDLSIPQIGILVNWFLMVAFAQSALGNQTILIHASVVEHNGNGYAFLGKSGTGKSTHSSLWIKYLKEYELLNDDNPAIRAMENGEVRVYGTPWSGKTPCYRNRHARLRALVRLKQAPYNRFTPKEGKEALIAILPSCSAIRWNNHIFSALIDLLELILDSVSIHELECLPDQEAAILCNKEILKYQNN